MTDKHPSKRGDSRGSPDSPEHAATVESVAAAAGPYEPKIRPTPWGPVSEMQAIGLLAHARPRFRRLAKLLAAIGLVVILGALLVGAVVVIVAVTRN